MLNNFCSENSVKRYLIVFMKTVLAKLIFVGGCSKQVNCEEKSFVSYPKLLISVFNLSI